MNEHAIFLAAIEIADPIRRSAYLDQACADDPSLRTQVDALLAAHERSGEFLNVPVLQQIIDNSGTSKSRAKNGSDPHASEDEINLSFLEPSVDPGSLGRLRHYEVRKVIGRGGCGIVLKAFDEKLERNVAVKVMAPQLASTSPARKRFLREARATAAIRHKNVVSVYAVEEGPLPFLVMEYIEGETLQQRIDRTGPLDVEDVLRIGQQVADGLAAAHHSGLIHRDIKPGNILLEAGTDQLKITDFGLARSADDASITQSGMITGTPLYMSPEQAQALGIDHRSDLFSLGSVLYVMCSGRPPFRAASTLAVVKRVVEDQPRPIDSIIPEVPKWLIAIIAKLHAKDPCERFASAQEVGELLARCRSEFEQHGRVELPEDILAKLPQLESNAQEPDADEFQPTPGKCVPGKQDHTARSHSPNWAAAAAIALVLVIGLGMTDVAGVTNIGGTAIRMFSPEGTLVIEVDDPGVSVNIDGEQMIITGAGAKEIRLKPGRYQLQASKDGKLLRQQIVNVTRSGRQVVRVHWEESPTENGRSSDQRWPNDTPPPAIAPFDADKAKRLQQEWADFLDVPVEREIIVGQNKDGQDVNLTMVLIPPGEFLMGSSDQERTQFLEGYAKAANDQWAASRIPSEGPEHPVRITRPFYLGKYEVTQAQWQAVMGDNPSKFNDHPAHPVEKVSWNDIQPFLAKLNERDFAGKLKFALPTEAQWEFACRAGTTTTWHSGDDQAVLREFGWFHGHADGKTHSVGRLKPNPLGLYDLHGNVWEWCADRFADDYYAKAPVDDPNGPGSGTNRAIRGGCAMYHANYCRSASRDHNHPGHRFGGLGFRIAAALPP